jgi:SOS-response transcriptional repressor LexA
MDLTQRQREIIEFVRGFSARRGSSPTCSEIQNHFGFASPATESAHLELLEKKGAIQREPRKARNIFLRVRRFLSTFPSLERFPQVTRQTSNRNPTAAFPLIPIPSIFHEMPGRSLSRCGVIR